jgi:NADP-dependent 3-hydroxy acid dehydrogenase YdfG
LDTKPGKQLTAIVTGASQGIGKAIVQRLVDDGVSVILAGRSVEKLNVVLAEFAAGDNRSCSKNLDLADTGEIEKFVKGIADMFEQIDILVLCAAAYHGGAWTDATIDDLDELYRTNVRGNYTLIQKMLPLLIRAKGDIVFVNSSVINSSGAGVGQYAATKHALKGMSRSLRDEINQHGVRVLSVYPGRTATPMQESIFHNEGREYLPGKLLQPGDIADVVAACLKLPDTAEVTELHIRPKHPT